MPNDAKLGLLAGVIGVIAVAIVSAKGPKPREAPISHPSINQIAGSLQPAGAGQTEHPSAHLPRTRPEPDGPPTSLKPIDDIAP